MDILWLILIFPIALAIGVIFDKDIKSVPLEKINVGERIMIKGEFFTILRYSPGGVIEARKDGTDDVFYINYYISSNEYFLFVSKFSSQKMVNSTGW